MSIIIYLMDFSEEDKNSISILIEESERMRRSGKSVRIMSFTDLYELAESAQCIHPVEKIMMLNPECDKIDVPHNLKKIEQQIYSIGTLQYYIWNIFLSSEVHEAFYTLLQECLKSTEMIPIISSGYRSSAYQVVLTFQMLKQYNWDYSKVSEVLEFPGKSEHNNPTHHAIDIFCSQTQGQAGEHFSVLKEFEHTDVYSWMTRNAQDYGFSLSYPKNNTAGKIFEPWHWKFTG